jgi:hypothetical protein
MTVDTTAVNKMTVGGMADDEMTVDEMIVNKNCRRYGCI